MTVRELIEELLKLPQDYIVSYEGGEYMHNWQEVNKVEVSHFSTLGTPTGVYLG